MQGMSRKRRGSLLPSDDKVRPSRTLEIVGSSPRKPYFLTKVTILLPEKGRGQTYRSSPLFLKDPRNGKLPKRSPRGDERIVSPQSRKTLLVEAPYAFELAHLFPLPRTAASSHCQSALLTLLSLDWIPALDFRML